MNNSNIKTISVIKMIGQGDYISLSYFLSLWYDTNIKILSLLSGKFRYIFLCSDSGDWGHPSASIVYRFPRNLWERDTVLAEVDFCHFGASLYSSLQARYFCSLVVQGIASVLVYFLGWGHRGNAPVKLCIVAFNFPKL